MIARLYVLVLLCCCVSALAAPRLLSAVVTRQVNNCDFSHSAHSEARQLVDVSQCAAERCTESEVMHGNSSALLALLIHFILQWHRTSALKLPSSTCHLIRFESTCAFWLRLFVQPMYLNGTLLLDVAYFLHLHPTHRQVFYGQQGHSQTGFLSCTMSGLTRLDCPNGLSVHSFPQDSSAKEHDSHMLFPLDSAADSEFVWLRAVKSVLSLA